MDYKVTQNYHNEQFDFDLVEGDIVNKASFKKTGRGMLDRLVGRGILIPVGTEPIEDENKNWRS